MIVVSSRGFRNVEGAKGALKRNVLVRSGEESVNLVSMPGALRNAHEEVETGGDGTAQNPQSRMTEVGHNNSNGSMESAVSANGAQEVGGEEVRRRRQAFGMNGTKAHEQRLRRMEIQLGRARLLAQPWEESRHRVVHVLTAGANDGTTTSGQTPSPEVTWSRNQAVLDLYPLSGGTFKGSLASDTKDEWGAMSRVSFLSPVSLVPRTDSQEDPLDLLPATSNQTLLSPINEECSTPSSSCSCQRCETCPWRNVGLTSPVTPVSSSGYGSILTASMDSLLNESSDGRTNGSNSDGNSTVGAAAGSSSLGIQQNGMNFADLGMNRDRSSEPRDKTSALSHVAEPCTLVIPTETEKSMSNTAWTPAHNADVSHVCEKSSCKEIRGANCVLRKDLIQNFLQKDKEAGLQKSVFCDECSEEDENIVGMCESQSVSAAQTIGTDNQRHSDSATSSTSIDRAQVTSAQQSSLPFPVELSHTCFENLQNTDELNIRESSYVSTSPTGKTTMQENIGQNSANTFCVHHNPTEEESVVFVTSQNDKGFLNLWDTIKGDEVMISEELTERTMDEKQEADAEKSPHLNMSTTVSSKVVIGGDDGHGALMWSDRDHRCSVAHAQVTSEQNKESEHSLLLAEAHSVLRIDGLYKQSNSNSAKAYEVPQDMSLDPREGCLQDNKHQSELGTDHPVSLFKPLLDRDSDCSQTGTSKLLNCHDSQNSCNAALLAHQHLSKNVDPAITTHRGCVSEPNDFQAESDSFRDVQFCAGTITTEPVSMSKESALPSSSRAALFPGKEKQSQVNKISSLLEKWNALEHQLAQSNQRKPPQESTKLACTSELPPAASQDDSSQGFKDRDDLAARGDQDCCIPIASYSVEAIKQQQQFLSVVNADKDVSAPVSTVENTCKYQSAFPDACARRALPHVQSLVAKFSHSLPFPSAGIGSVGNERHIQLSHKLSCHHQADLQHLQKSHSIDLQHSQVQTAPASLSVATVNARSENQLDAKTPSTVAVEVSPFMNITHSHRMRSTLAGSRLEKSTDKIAEVQLNHSSESSAPFATHLPKVSFDPSARQAVISTSSLSSDNRELQLSAAHHQVVISDTKLL